MTGTEEQIGIDRAVARDLDVVAAEMGGASLSDAISHLIDIRSLALKYAGLVRAEAKDENDI